MYDVVMSTPRSVRLSDDVAARLERHVRRTGGSTSSVIERLLDEALRAAEHPLIFFQDNPSGRRARLVGGTSVWTVVSALSEIQAGRSTPARPEDVVGELVEVCGIPEHLVRAAISYYAQFPVEIDAWIAENRRLGDEHQAAWLREQEILTGPAA